MPKMSIQELLVIWADNPTAFDVEPQHIRDQYGAQVQAMRDGAKLDPETGKLKRPRGDREAMPPGYVAGHVSRGDYSISGPDGFYLMDGDSPAKYHGKEAAADAAWKHYRNE